MLTPHLALPLIAPAQAQKHVTHNEAITALDALVHLAVLSRGLATPPANPQAGDRHIVGPSPVGAWAGHAEEVASWEDGRWRFFPPRRGFLAFDLGAGRLLAFDGLAWADALATLAALSLDRLGIGTAASAANPLSARLNDALLTARPAGDGGTGDLRVKLSKEGAGGVLSLLLQTGFSGRAELGLVGDDDFAVKVSADGAAWQEALRVERATGVVRFPAGAVLPGGRNLLLNGSFAVNQRGHAGAALGPGAPGHDRWRAGAAGAAYTVAEGSPDALATITAGTLCQTAAGGLVSGGTYTLSWEGTAPGRVGGGAYGPSPLTVAGVAPGTPLTAEFGPGTLTRAQLEAGGAASPFERRHDEAALCRRHLWRRGGAAGEALGVAQATSVGTLLLPLAFPTPLAAAPAVAAAGLEALGPGGAALAVTGVAASGATRSGALLTLTTAGGLTAGQAALVRFATAAGFVEADAG